METDKKTAKKTWEKENPDWEAVKKMYVTTDMTYKQVAEHFGLKYHSVRGRGVKGKWLIEKYNNMGEEPPKKKKSELKLIDAKMNKKKSKGPESKYRSDIHDPLIYQLTKDNKTLYEMAEKYLLIDIETLKLWMKKHESFERAYRAGLEDKLDKVEQNIYERSAGIRYTETVTTVITGKDGEEKREVKTYDRYSLPDVGAAKLILTTQRREKWAENMKNDTDDNREIKIVISEAKEPAIEEDEDNGN